MSKTTPRGSAALASRALLVLALFALVGTPAHAFDLRIVYANDYLVSNPLSDDLYTGALVLEFNVGQHRIVFGENTFTDSDNDLRFDETYLAVERRLGRVGAWTPAVEVGVLHVGRGLLGQDAQNAVHRLLGDEEVDLTYVESGLHPTLRLRLHRALPRWYGLDWTAQGELYSAFDFQRHASFGVRMQWQATTFGTVSAGLGARYSATDFAALEPRIQDLGPTWEAGFAFRGGPTISWSYNRFGTRSKHFAVAFDVTPRKLTGKPRRTEERR